MYYRQAIYEPLSQISNHKCVCKKKSLSGPLITGSMLNCFYHIIRVYCSSTKLIYFNFITSSTLHRYYNMRTTLDQSIIHTMYWILRIVKLELTRDAAYLGLNAVS